MPSVGSVISYPIPAYQNVPIHAEFYKPKRFVISAITLGQTTTITTTTNMDYVIGQLCRLIIPASCKCIQLNEAEAYVISIPAPNQVVLNIVSANFDQFVSSVTTIFPQILAIGDINTGAVNSNGCSNNFTYIPGSFINISPQ